MDFLTTKKLCMLLVIISASLISISYAGRNIRPTDSLYNVNKATSLSMDKYYNDEFLIQERALRETTLDYGINDPTPSRDDPPNGGIPHHHE
ncbi:protein CASPARIAN STRIP INTEGRITY FACTOR 1-like [Silene latifolia]|uniref:protein CASPARIAN STRIP INTEGRITY FACTOR 1-like n=1 Tax=Silene latifolia TaxID=37657 RepID=UPI003D7789D3